MAGRSGASRQVSIDELPVALLLLSGDGGAVLNGHARALIGTGCAQDPDCVARLVEVAAAVDESGGVPGRLVDLQHRDGRVLHLGVSSARLSDGRLAAVLRDATEEVVAQRRLERRVQFERLLMESSATLMRSDDDALDDAIVDMLGAVGRFFGVDRAYVFQIDLQTATQSNTHEWVAAGISRESANLQGMPLDTFPWLFTQLRADRVFVVEDIASLPAEAASERSEFEREGIQSLLIVPLWTGSELQGFVGFDAVRSRVGWDEPYVIGLRLMAQMLAGALETRSIAHRLRMQAHHDPLTGLPNRLFLHDRFHQSTRRLPADRLSKVVVAVVDVDDFKLVNDHHGHAAGDALLREVAQRLQAAAGESAVVARIGGDEFVILDPSGTRGEAELGARLLEVASQPFDIAGSPRHVGLSIGVARNAGVARDLGPMLQHADGAMYRAKTTGKNRWAGHEPEATAAALDA